MIHPALASVLPVLLQAGGIFETPLGQLFVVLLGVGAVILVGRLLLHVAWRLVTIAALVVGVLLVVSMFAPGLL
ncbi:hypothetical protein SAMN04487948_101510 [Halogranum amylolyticum]|uniref:Uncharacterized protein n=1 Tax=Halogranum amylolyticum TaxID=660520 RepID=A0A1H8NFA4_9EURY|nr:hypothetical protein [Halogranum amylolyticum]SEO28246.1 hypothetical protein SAMN04487948_101510 [Halogranum amylolyticum]